MCCVCISLGPGVISLLVLWLQKFGSSCSLLMYLQFSHGLCANTHRQWNKISDSDFKALLQGPILSVSPEIPAMLSHGGTQGGYCVQVLLCLLDLAGLLGMTRDQSTQWVERGRRARVALANSSPHQAWLHSPPLLCLDSVGTRLRVPGLWWLTRWKVFWTQFPFDVKRYSNCSADFTLHIVCAGLWYQLSCFFKKINLQMSHCYCCPKSFSISPSERTIFKHTNTATHTHKAASLQT